MAKSSNEITQDLFEAVDTIIEERISALPYDQTIVCQIVDATDHANGIYIVTHNYNTKFSAYADFTGYNLGDYVYVRIPEGDYTSQKVITGKYLEGSNISNVIAYNTGVDFNSYNNKLVLCSSNTNIILPDNDKLITNLQFDVYKNSANTNIRITFRSEGGRYLYSTISPNGTNRLVLSEVRGIVNVRRIAQNHWLLTGPMTTT